MIMAWGCSHFFGLQMGDSGRYLTLAKNLAGGRGFSSASGPPYWPEVFRAPLHPYTRALLSAVPIANPRRERARQRIILEGDVPSPANPPSGCRFHPRCAFATTECSTVDPPLRNLAAPSTPAHWVACHYAERFIQLQEVSPQPTVA